MPEGHPLLSGNDITLEAIAEYPIITYDEGLTGRRRIDEAFENAGVVPDIAMSALDADVIKAYVELGLGIGIIASIAFRCRARQGPRAAWVRDRCSDPTRRASPSGVDASCAPTCTGSSRCARRH